MMSIQILVALFVLFVLGRLLLQFRTKKLATRAYVLWSLLWLAVLVVFWSPELTSRLATFFGIGRGADLVIYLAVIIIFYLLYRIFIRLEKISSDLTVISRHAAIRHEEERNQRSTADRQS